MPTGRYRDDHSGAWWQHAIQANPRSSTADIEEITRLRPSDGPLPGMGNLHLHWNQRRVSGELSGFLIASSGCHDSVCPPHCTASRPLSSISGDRSGAMPMPSKMVGRQNLLTSRNPSKSLNSQSPPRIPDLGRGVMKEDTMEYSQGYGQPPAADYRRGPRSSDRYWMASAMCSGWIVSRSSRSAMVRATFRIRS